MASNYEQLKSQDADLGEKEETQFFLLQQEQENSPSIRKTLPPWWLVLSTFISGCLFTVAMSRSKNLFWPTPSYEIGWREEILLPASAIQTEERKFTTSLSFNVEDGSEYLVTTPGAEMYVGATDKTVDAAWEELIAGRYFSISESEAKSLWGKAYQMYQDKDRTGYSGGFDMFHQLHCLNQIRQALHRDVYPENPIHGPVHLDHCIDHLRQSIQCWGSLAVVPLKFYEGYHHNYVKSDVVHTCRKWAPIREFVWERFNGSLYMPRPNDRDFR